MINEHNSPQIHQSVCRNLSPLPRLKQDVDKRRKGNREREAFFIFPKGEGWIYEGDEYQASWPLQCHHTAFLWDCVAYQKRQNRRVLGGLHLDYSGRENFLNVVTKDHQFWRSTRIVARTERKKVVYMWIISRFKVILERVFNLKNIFLKISYVFNKF